MSSISQPFTTRLDELNRRFRFSNPHYIVLPTERGGGFYCTVIIAGKSYTGAIRLDEKEAMESAAEAALSM